MGTEEAQFDRARRRGRHVIGPNQQVVAKKLPTKGVTTGEFEHHLIQATAPCHQVDQLWVAMDEPPPGAQ